MPYVTANALCRAPKRHVDAETTYLLPEGLVDHPHIASSDDERLKKIPGGIPGLRNLTACAPDMRPKDFRDPLTIVFDLHTGNVAGRLFVCHQRLDQGTSE
jgi:hypothetical protein